LGGRTGGGWWRSPRQMVAVVVPMVMVLLVAVWWVAYEMGRSRAEDSLERMLGQQGGTQELPGSGDSLPISDPTATDGAGTDGAKTDGSAAKSSGSSAKKGTSSGVAGGEGGSGDQGGAGGPSGPAVQPGAATELVPGMNYLVVATLKRREDALEAANYLQGKGLRMAAVRERDDWVVLVLQGYDRSQFTAKERERRVLRERVQAAGRTWRAENKAAPTDFAQPFWRRQPDLPKTP